MQDRLHGVNPTGSHASLKTPTIGEINSDGGTHLHLEEAVLLQQLLLMGVVGGCLQGALLLDVASHGVCLRSPHAWPSLGGEAWLRRLARSVLVEPCVLTQAAHLRAASLHL